MRDRLICELVEFETCLLASFRSGCATAFTEVPVLRGESPRPVVHIQRLESIATRSPSQSLASLTVLDLADAVAGWKRSFGDGDYPDNRCIFCPSGTVTRPERLQLHWVTMSRLVGVSEIRNAGPAISLLQSAGRVCGQGHRRPERRGEWQDSRSMAKPGSFRDAGARASRGVGARRRPRMNSA